MKSPLRIWIIGLPGSGKSTLASALADRYSLPAVELDHLYWLEDWQRADTADFIADVEKQLTSDDWVVAGSYPQAEDLILQGATHVVLLELPFGIAWVRVVMRSIKSLFSRRVLWRNNRERLSRLLSSNSMPVYLLREGPTIVQAGKNTAATAESRGIKTIQINSSQTILDMVREFERKR